VRCLLAAIRCEKGDLAGNLSAHLRLVDQAAAAGCQLAVFPEMSLTGSADPATRPERLIALTHPAVARLATASAAAGTGICFGIAERAPGQQPYITQVVAAAGRIAGLQRKRHLGEGEEAFAPAAGHAVFEHAGVKFGVAICAEAGFGAPFDHAAAAGATLVLFPAAPGRPDPPRRHRRRPPPRLAPRHPHRRHLAPLTAGRVTRPGQAVRGCEGSLFCPYSRRW
jgi:predicted amidohydrolase